MKPGNFFFLKDSYFEKFSDQQGILQNKGNENFRPYFYAFDDKNNPNIFWAVPISSQCEKYLKIYNNSKAKYGRCDTIVFGKVLGKNKAFLIQNMCPVSKEYVSSEYMLNGINVSVHPKVEETLIRKARAVIAKYNHGVKLIFPDVHKMCKELNTNPIEQFCQNWVNTQADNNLNMATDNTLTEEEEQGW